jgi:glyoxylase-like metal-dependent hydrolase (beta-lactamase superfamily II)
VTESKAAAESIVEVVPGVWHWNVDDERIGGYIGSSHAVVTVDGTILIDPHRLPPGAFTQIGDVAAIVLTASTHQRAAWFYRRELGAHVWVPSGTRQAEEEPDERYSEGDQLPGGLEAFFAPGAGTTQHALRHDKVLFVGDNVVRPRGGELMLISEEYAHDAAQNRESVRKLLDVDFEILCLGHGEPVTSNAKDTLAALL